MDKPCNNHAEVSLPTKQTSMCSLIIWNISKALERNPSMDLGRALRLAHERVQRETCDAKITQPPEHRHLMCALLAWQHLGHENTESLHQFVIENRNKLLNSVSENQSNKDNIKKIDDANVSVKPQCSFDQKHTHKHSQYSKNDNFKIFDTYSQMGPVVKLPVDTKIVMRMENDTCARHHANKPQQEKKDTMNKIDAACCKESACVQRLTDLDTAVSELRTRAARLARREADRVTLLERAEAAWKDLEIGYQRRLSLCEEKEDDMMKEIKKLVDERNGYKTVCTTMAQTLREYSDSAESDRSRLSEIEQGICDRACARVRLSEESARGDSALADQLCRLSQLDRDLQFKEEQTRRKILVLESEVDSRRGLTHEAERATRAELKALKEQLVQVSEQLLAEESENNTIRIELESLHQENSEIIEDLDGCKVMCDSRMQGRVDELKQKKEQLNELKERVLECRCKLPQDASVEVKRTPSLAALCYCSAEDKYLESCSCTSLGSQLLSNLLADLFGGLQSELEGSGYLMPCQHLKCLEDRHNWDRSSLVKTNLLKFFGQLLTGELDIAIATSIEKYHAKWVGASCADLVRIIPDPGDVSQNEGWEERAIERRAQKLATELAERLFKERAEELTRKAKEIMSTGPPPCECKPQAAAVFPCLVKQPTLTSNRKTNDTGPSYLKRAMQDVTLLRTEIEGLKKDSIKKEDLRRMEEKITKIFQKKNNMKVENITSTSKNMKIMKEIHDDTINKCTNNAIANFDSINFSKKAKTLQDTCKFRKTMKCPLNNQTKRFDKHSDKLFKKIEQSFAVNLCLCGEQKVNKPHIGRLDLCPSFKPKKGTDIITTTSSIRRSKPISLMSSREQNFYQESKYSTHPICPSDCVCLYKIPSNTSIDRLLETLTKWKGDLGKTTSCNENDIIEKDENNGEMTQVITRPPIEKEISNYNPINNFTYEYKEKLNNSSNFNQNIEKLPSTEVRNKFTTYTGLPPATASEYIGEINLDKSNDVFCKCNRNTDVKHGDGIVAVSSIRFQCINTDSCNCNKSIQLIETEKRNKDKNSFEMKNESQIYSRKKDTSSTPSYKTGVEIGGEFIKNVVKKSDLFPSNCDYKVKFLGVTLANTKTNNKLRENSDSNAVDKFVDVMDPTVKNFNKKNSLLKDVNKKDKYNLRRGLNTCDYESQLLDTLNSSQDQKSFSLEITEKKEGTCVCCSQPDLPSELEVNVFNLLEEHLKGKFIEFQRSMCKTSCLPPDKEKHLFSNILNKVKQVISESTVKLTCKCVQEKASEGSWSRAYGLLQEYLKIKIKRVQCTCISSDKNTESILPGILEKVNNLIELDFQKLKDKCLSENKKDNSTSEVINNQRTKSVQEIQDKNETFVQFDMRDTDYVKDKLLQASNMFCCNKSCETLDNKLFNLNTLEKKVSCKLQTAVYGTQCDCRYTFNEYFQLNKDAIVKQCLDLIPNKDKEVNDTFNIVAGASSTNYSSVESSVTPKEKKEENEGPKSIAKHPYIGYTVNCSCDRALGNCHCTKSMVETNNDNIEFIWKSLTNDLYPKKNSYIMPKIVTNVRSENSHLNKNNEYYCNTENNFKLTDRVSKDDKQCCNIEINTINNEDIKLKNSEEKYTSRTEAYTSDMMNVERDLNAETMLYESGQHSMNGSRYSTDTSTGKSKLYHSLYKYNNTDYSQNPHFDSHLEDNLKIDSDSEQCNCKMVPICHVKMLVDNIEKKIINSKRTCDALLSPTCPILFKKDYY